MTAQPNTAPDSVPLVDTAVDLGLHWARYGLALGRMAVRSHAVTLRAAATLLDEVGDALEARTKPAATPPNATEPAPDPVAK